VAEFGSMGLGAASPLSSDGQRLNSGRTMAVR